MYIDSRQQCKAAKEENQCRGEPKRPNVSTSFTFHCSHHVVGRCSTFWANISAVRMTTYGALLVPECGTEGIFLGVAAFTVTGMSLADGGRLGSIWLKNKS